jgi:hypothetical protein
MVMALARAIAIAMECPTVDRTFGMLAPAQRATPGKGLRLASQTLIPGHVRREPDVGHPTPEARLYPPTQTYAPPPTHINDEKKKIFLFSELRIPLLGSLGKRGRRRARSDGSRAARGADCAVGSG